MCASTTLTWTISQGASSEHPGSKAAAAAVAAAVVAAAPARAAEQQKRHQQQQQWHQCSSDTSIVAAVAAPVAAAAQAAARCSGSGLVWAITQWLLPCPVAAAGGTSLAGSFCVVGPSVGNVCMRCREDLHAAGRHAAGTTTSSSSSSRGNLLVTIDTKPCTCGQQLHALLAAAAGAPGGHLMCSLCSSLAGVAVGDKLRAECCHC
jgi:hypothetical protein